MVRAVRDGDVAGYALRDRQPLLGSRRRARIAPREPAFVRCGRSRNANPGTNGQKELAPMAMSDAKKAPLMGGALSFVF